VKRQACLQAFPNSQDGAVERHESDSTPDAPGGPGEQLARLAVGELLAVLEKGHMDRDQLTIYVYDRRQQGREATDHPRRVAGFPIGRARVRLQGAALRQRPQTPRLEIGDHVRHEVRRRGRAQQIADSTGRRRRLGRPEGYWSVTPPVVAVIEPEVLAADLPVIINEAVDIGLAV
jgi:hypothetical protein